MGARYIHDDFKGYTTRGSGNYASPCTFCEGVWGSWRPAPCLKLISKVSWFSSNVIMALHGTILYLFLNADLPQIFDWAPARKCLQPTKRTIYRISQLSQETSTNCTVDRIASELADDAAYAAADAERSLRVHSPDGSTAWNNVMIAILKVWRQIKNPTPAVDVHLLKNSPVKFHSNPIWNDGALRPVSIMAARCVAWRCVARDIDETPILLLFLSPRNATRSRNGNRPLGFLKAVAPPRSTRTTTRTSSFIWDQSLVQILNSDRYHFHILHYVAYKLQQLFKKASVCSVYDIFLRQLKITAVP